MNSISSVVRGTAMAMSPVHHKGPECACRDQMRVHIRVCVCACGHMQACVFAGLQGCACMRVGWLEGTGVYVRLLACVCTCAHVRMVSAYFEHQMQRACTPVNACALPSTATFV